MWEEGKKSRAIPTHILQWIISQPQGFYKMVGLLLHSVLAKIQKWGNFEKPVSLKESLKLMQMWSTQLQKRPKHFLTLLKNTITHYLLNYIFPFSAHCAVWVQQYCSKVSLQRAIGLKNGYPRGYKCRFDSPNIDSLFQKIFQCLNFFL